MVRHSSAPWAPQPHRWRISPSRRTGRHDDGPPERKSTPTFGFVAILAKEHQDRNILRLRAGKSFCCFVSGALEKRPSSRYRARRDLLRPATTLSFQSGFLQCGPSAPTQQYVLPGHHRLIFEFQICVSQLSRSTASATSMSTGSSADRRALQSVRPRRQIFGAMGLIHGLKPREHQRRPGRYSRRPKTGAYWASKGSTC